MKWWTYNGRAERIAARWLDIQEGDTNIYKLSRQRWKTYQERAAQYNDLSSRANLECLAGTLGIISKHMPEAADLIAHIKAAK